MACTVTSPCVGTRDTACMQVCPVDCFFDVPLSEIGIEEPEGVDANPELKKMLLINPDECIDCDLCIAECPVQAIYSDSDVPEEEQAFLDIQNEFFSSKDSEELEKLRITP